MRDKQRFTPLHHAVPNRSDPDALKKQKIAFLKLMLNDRGALRDALDTSRQDNDARTALHLAVIEGSVEAVELLKEWDTVVIADNFRKLPLHYALETGALDIVEVLLSCGDPKAQTCFDLFGNRPVDIAQRNQQHDVLRLFAEYEERYERMPEKHENVRVDVRPTVRAPGAAEPQE
jgi:ankyrin repeat protein